MHYSGNIFYSLFHYAHALNYLESFIDNIYFTTIVYYVALKLIGVWQDPKHKRTGTLFAHIVYAVSLVLFLCILIDKFLTPYNNCSCKKLFIVETWYLVVNGVGVGLSITLFIAGFRYTKKQQKKLIGIHNPENYKNPLLDIWIWIGLNIFSQICSLIETIIFKASGNCSFSTVFNISI